MRIAFLTREYPPDSLWGGPAIVYYNYARSLSEKGHEVHVICQAIEHPRDLIEQGVFVHRVGTNPNRWSVAARINYSVHSWLKLRRLIEKYRIDVVEAVYWSAEGLLYSLQRHTPLVIAAQTPVTTSIKLRERSRVTQLLPMKALSFIADFTARRADRIIANSRSTYVRLARGICKDTTRLDLIYHGVDTREYKAVRTKARESLDVPESSPIVLFVGRLEPRKGVHVLFKAIPEILSHTPDARFVLVGKDTNTGPKGTSFKQSLLNNTEIRAWRENIVFVDFLPQDELIGLYSACDVFVLPSLVESFGLPIIEAMACGKPVVATKTGIAPEIGLKPPYGFTIRPADAEELAAAIMKLLSLEREEIKLVSQRNREFVEANFSVTTSTDKLLSAYHKATKTYTESKLRVRR